MTTHRPSLLGNIGWTLAGQAAYSMSQWSVIVAVANVADSKAVGTLAYAVALVAPAVALASLQLRVVMLTAAGARFAFAQYLKLRVTLLVLVAGGLAGYCAVAQLDATTMWTVGGVALWRGFDAVAEIYYARWQRGEMMARVSKALVLNGVLSVGAVVGCVTIWRTPIAAAFASASGSAITVLLVATRRNADGGSGSLVDSGGGIGRLALLAAPLGVVATLIAIQGNVPRYVIEAALGPAALGIFAAASQLPGAGGNVVAAVATAVSRRLVAYYTKRDFRAFCTLLFGLVAFGVFLGAAGAALSFVAGRAILTFVYGSEYGEYSYLLVLLSGAAGIGFAGSFLGYGMTMAGESRPQAPLFAVIVLITLATSALLIPRYGLGGAAFAIASASLCQCAGSVLVLRRATSAPAPTQAV